MFRDNPPWADKAMKKSWDQLKSSGLPLPIVPRGWKFEDLGCGHYGCVFATEELGVVFKLTSDPTEARFIQLAKPLGWPEGIVEYYGIVELDFTFRTRTVFAVWREEAYSVGKLDNLRYDPNDYESRSQRAFSTHLDRFRAHAARFRDTFKRSKDPQKLLRETRRLEEWAWRRVDEEMAYGMYGYRAFDRLRGAERAAASWRACEYIAEMMENTYLSGLVGGAFKFYMDHGFLLADVHLGNVGQVKRDEDYTTMPWVITDPGHVVVVNW